MSEIIYLAAGCFWSVEYRLSRLPGVVNTEVGYAGGDLVNPTYEDVCSGTSGHTETVKVEFDPKVITLQQILAEFFSLHDPTQLNRQGPDLGTNYRSAIFVTNASQFDIALQVIKEQAVNFSAEIVTELAKLENFYIAEEYHQSYIAKKRGEC